MQDTEEWHSHDARLGSLDAYRGLAMLLMIAEVLHLCHVADHFPATSGQIADDIWHWLCFHQSHVAWVGCSIHDMIQPSFTFMVGVALPYSLASRAGRGQSRLRMTLHAFWRAMVLVGLGIFLRSLGREQTNFTFDDTLTQIGLGYGFLFLIGQLTKRAQWLWLAGILVAYWLAFIAYPAPPDDYNYDAVVSKQDHIHLQDGFESHWNKNSNLAHAFDTWWLNLFPRQPQCLSCGSRHLIATLSQQPQPEQCPDCLTTGQITTTFTHHGGGYQTLNFIPTLGTMILGLLAGGILRSGREDAAKLFRLVLLGVLLLAVGYGMNELRICPIVKRIWTPSWTIYSGGWCFLILAAMYFFVDVLRWRTVVFPLTVIGMNSIAIYCMSWMLEGFFHDVIARHFTWVTETVPAALWSALGYQWIPAYSDLLSGVCVVFAFWCILFWMYRRRIFLKI